MWESSSHKWNAARINGEWYLFDTTWGSIYRDIPATDKTGKRPFCMMDPVKMLETHMPFDYLWQFVEQPLTYDDFASGKIVAKSEKRFFNFEEEITINERLGGIEQMSASVLRIKENGTINDITERWLEHLQAAIRYYQRSTHIEIYEKAKANYEAALQQYNEFARQVRKDPNAKKNSLKLLEKASGLISKALFDVNRVTEADSDVQQGFAQLSKALGELKQLVDKSK